MHVSPFARVRRQVCFAALLILPFFGSSLDASILVTNLDQPYRSATPIANPEFWGAQSFYLHDETPSQALSWIEAFVGVAVDNPKVVAELRRADVDGEIDQSAAGLLTAFVPPDVNGPASARVFSPLSSVTLEPATKYWFILGNSGAGVFDWGYANTGLWSGDGGYLSNYADSSTAGTEWVYRSADFPYFIQVNVNELGQQWNLDGDGDWSVPGNWLGGAPNAFGAVANFTSVITADRTVTVDAEQTVGQINFDNANRYTIAGTSALTLDGVAAAINVVSGSHEILAPLTLAAGTTVDIAPADATLTLWNLAPTTVGLTKTGEGELAVNVLRAPSLNIDAGTVRVLPDGTANATTHLATLAIPGGATPVATLDLEDNDMIVTAMGYNIIASKIAHARNGGAWDQTGITSSAAANAAPRNKTLGVLRGNQYLSTGVADFDGFAVNGSDILVKYTYYGDTDFNGVVNFDDYARTDAGFNTGATDWFHGDFDYNGLVNFDDYSLIDLAFNTQNGSLLRAAAYLDGTDRSDGDMNTPALRLVQEHFEQFGVVYATSFLQAVPEPTAAMRGVAFLLPALARRRR